jgi:osomolarity two-component system sensor histidine kinase NIK1
LKILLVEDNLLNQKVVLFNLKKYDYDILAVTNGLDAIKAVMKNRFDLILMDIMLPGMNGFEITEKIRHLETERAVKEPVPIIALTANALDNDREKCISVGMNEYLSKPFTANELREKIEKFVRLEV